MQIKRFWKQHENARPPRVTIRDSKVFYNLVSFIQMKTVEIMLLGVIEQIEDEYTITELLIPPMDSNSGAFVTTDDEKFGPWLYNLPREKRSKLRMHLHTHPKMAVNPSGTDEQMIRDKVENISDFYIRIIANEKLNFRVDFFDLKHGILYENTGLEYIQNYKTNYHIMTFTSTSSDYAIVPKKDHKMYKQLEQTLEENIKKAPTRVIQTGAPHGYQYANEKNWNYFDTASNKFVQPKHVSTSKTETDKIVQRARLIRQYNLAENEKELKGKFEDFIYDTLSPDETLDDIQTRSMNPEDERYWFRLYLENYYDIKQNAYSAEELGKLLATIIPIELDYVGRLDKQFREMEVKQLMDEYMPYLDMCIAVINKGNYLTEEDLASTVEEWLENAEYFKTPGLL